MLDSKWAMLVQVTLESVVGWVRWGASSWLIVADSFCAKELVDWGSHLCAEERGAGAGYARFSSLSWRSSCSCPAQPRLEPYYGDDTIKGVGNEATGTGEGSRGKKLSANREIFCVCLCFKPLLSQDKLTWILKKIRVCVRHGSFDVCRDVLKYEWGKYFCINVHAAITFFLHYNRGSDQLLSIAYILAEHSTWVQVFKMLVWVTQKFRDQTSKFIWTKNVTANAFRGAWMSEN